LPRLEAICRRLRFSPESDANSRLLQSRVETIPEQSLDLRSTCRQWNDFLMMEDTHTGTHIFQKRQRLPRACNYCRLKKSRVRFIHHIIEAILTIHQCNTSPQDTFCLTIDKAQTYLVCKSNEAKKQYAVLHINPRCRPLIVAAFRI
jgi:hypothetical protein